MEIDGLLSAVFVGLVIGLLARLVVPGGQPIGCLLTILAGIVGALGGAALAHSWGVTGLLLIALQVLVAALLVAVLDRAVRRR